MKFIYESRVNYINLNKYEFHSEDEIKKYLNDWGANYELSDFLQDFNKSENFDLLKNTFFMRKVSWDIPD